METFSQLPGTLNIDIIAGDSLSLDVDFDISLAGFTLTASIVSIPSGAIVAPITATLTSGPDGIVSLSMTAEQTAALARGTYQWELTWTDGFVTRKGLTGFLEVRNR